MTIEIKLWCSTHGDFTLQLGREHASAVIIAKDRLYRLFAKGRLDEGYSSSASNCAYLVTDQIFRTLPVPSPCRCTLHCIRPDVDNFWVGPAAAAYALGGLQAIVDMMKAYP